MSLLGLNIRPIHLWLYRLIQTRIYLIISATASLATFATINLQCRCCIATVSLQRQCKNSQIVRALISKQNYFISRNKSTYKSPYTTLPTKQKIVSRDPAQRWTFIGNTNKNEPLTRKPIIKIIVKKQSAKYSGVICFCEQVVREGDLTRERALVGGTVLTFGNYIRTPKMDIQMK